MAERTSPFKSAMSQLGVLPWLSKVAYLCAAPLRPFKGLDPAVLSGSWLAIAIACTGFALDYALNLALSQWLAPSDLGDYSVAVSVAVFGGMFALFGTDQALMQFVPQYLEKNDWSRIRGLLTFSFCLAFGASLAFSLVALGFAFFGPVQETSHPLVVAFMVLPIVSLALLTSKALRGFRHVVMATAPMGIGLPVLVMAGGYVLAHDGVITDWNLVGVMGGSFFLILCLQVFVLSRDLLGPVRTAKPCYQSKEWASASVGLMMATVMFLAMEHAGLYMCELLADEVDVAIYAVLVKHARFLLMIFTAVNLITMTYIGPTLNSGDRERLQRIYGTGMHVVMWGGLVPLLVFIIKGEAILAAFGDDYVIGYPSLLILMGAYYINFVTGFSVPFLQFSGHRRIVIWSIAIALVIEIILFSLLVPVYGFSGAAWSMALTLTGLSIWITYQCQRRLGLKPLRLTKG